MTSPYRTITTRLRGIRPNSIFVDRPAARGKGEVSVPRSRKAMGGPTFQKSKTDVLDWAASLIGITPSDIPEHEAA